jgi:hypothetical protein
LTIPLLIPQEILIFGGIQTVTLAVPFLVTFLGLNLFVLLQTVACFHLLLSAELLTILSAGLIAILKPVMLTISLTVHAPVSRQTAGSRACHLGDTCRGEGEDESEDEGQNKE